VGNGAACGVAGGGLGGEAERSATVALLTTSKYRTLRRVQPFLNGL